MGDISGALTCQIHHEQPIGPQTTEGVSIKVARSKRRRDAGAIERIDQKDIRSPVTTHNKVSAVLKEDLEAIIVGWNVEPLSQCDAELATATHGYW
jgi:hypothetical protein